MRDMFRLYFTVLIAFIIFHILYNNGTISKIYNWICEIFEHILDKFIFNINF